MSEDVSILVSALISKMERMDAQIRDLNTQMHSADILLKRAGYVRATTPAAEDVWGDPLRGETDSVIAKAAEGFDGAMMTLPESNEAWHEMTWDEIHAMAEKTQGGSQ